MTEILLLGTGNFSLSGNNTLILDQEVQTTETNFVELDQTDNSKQAEMLVSKSRVSVSLGWNNAVARFVMQHIKTCQNARTRGYKTCR